uniref:Uncharacterized protein n=1 Tax=Anguilla anguilla TaxID=7936 RepID=A0A0E9SQK4_ANGAN
MLFLSIPRNLSVLEVFPGFPLRVIFSRNKYY